MPPAAKQQLDEFARFCGELRVEDGTPFELLPFWRAILGSYFAGATETAVLLPKKNGKTTVMAALALYHLLTTPNAECIIVAASRDQAEITLRQSRMFIRQSPPLAKQVKILQRTVQSLFDDGRIRVLASDEDTADGVIPTLAIVDELHRHKTADLYGVMADGLTPRKGRLLTISTAGSAMSSPLGQIRTKAHALPSFTRDGAYNHAVSADGSFAFHEWSLDQDADVEDMKVVKAANPAPWQTVEALQRRHDTPGMTKYRWLRFGCGIWTETEEPWLEPEIWDALRGDTDLDYGTVLGVRVGQQHRTAALVAIARDPEGRWAVAAKIYDLTSEESPLAFLEDEVRTMYREMGAESVVYLGKAFQRSALLLEEEGLAVVEIPFQPNRLIEASEILLKVVEERRLVHDGDDALRSSVLDGKVKLTEAGWRLLDSTEGTPPDALFALAAAIQIGESTVTGEPQVAVF